MGLTFSGSLYEPRPMPPEHYLKVVVDPLIQRFEQEPMANDLAVACTVSLWHSIDYVSQYLGKDISDVRSELKSFFPDFKYLHVAAHVLKHHTIDRSPAEFRGLSAVLQPTITISASQNGLMGSNSTPPSLRFEDGKNFIIIDLILSCRPHISTLFLEENKPKHHGH